MTPSILFKYFYLTELKEVCSIYAQWSSISEDLVSYSISSIKKDNELDNVHIVTLPRFLMSDIQLLHENTTEEDLFNWMDFNEEITKMHDEYGHEFMDMMITDDNDSIIKCITDAINFLMDKVYKTNKVQIAFESGKNVFQSDNRVELESNYPNLIYSALQQNFIIKEHRSMLNTKIIAIEKRSEDNNVYNAN